MKALSKRENVVSQTIPIDLIAPCGMNCRLCLGYVRNVNTCPGCLRINNIESDKSKYRCGCVIRSCDQLRNTGSKYCSSKCTRFPCRRLKQLDKRYRAKYEMSMIDNLEAIEARGVRWFVRDQKKKWTCIKCGSLLCVHRNSCLFCGDERKIQSLAQQGHGA